MHACVQASFDISDDIPGSIIAYSIKIISNSEVLLNSSLAPMPCVDINCEEFISVPFQCRSSTTVNVTLSAANRLGVGPTLDPIKIGKNSEDRDLQMIPLKCSIETQHMASHID